MKFFIALLTLYLGLSQITSVYAQNYDQIAPPVYSAASVVLMEASTGTILYSSNGADIKYPASITKIMTALIVLEHTSDFNERVLISERVIADTPRTSSHIAMDVGETLSVYEALYAMMLPSANDVSVALAEHIAGTVEDFVYLMNRRAHALGAIDTYFANPSGLPAAGHVTTAYDIALIKREAIQHPLFVDIIRTRRFDIPPTERQPEIRAIRNTNRLIQDGPEFNADVVGSKTGWTTAAGHTLVTFAERDGRQLIVSILGGYSPGTFADTTALLEYGFAIPFLPTQIFDAQVNTPAIPVFQEVNGTRAEITRVPLRAPEDIYVYLPQGFDQSQLRYEFSIPQGLAPPVEKGTALGNAAIYVRDFRLANVQLLAGETVEVYTPTAAASDSVLDGHVASVYHNTEAYYEPPAYTRGYTQPFWASELFFTLAVPLAISGFTLFVSLVVYFVKRKNRLRRKLHNRYARYPQYYRYK